MEVNELHAAERDESRSAEHALSASAAYVEMCRAKGECDGTADDLFLRATERVQRLETVRAESADGQVRASTSGRVYQPEDTTNERKAG